MLFLNIYIIHTRYITYNMYRMCYITVFVDVGNPERQKTMVNLCRLESVRVSSITLFPKGKRRATLTENLRRRQLIWWCVYIYI